MVLTEDTSSFIVGDRVYVDGIKPGRIQYIGMYVRMYCTTSQIIFECYFFHPKELVFEPEVISVIVVFFKREPHL